MFSTANGRNLAQISSTSLEKAKAIIDNSIDSSFCSYRENNINTPIKIPFPTSESGISDFSNSSNKVALTPTGLTMKSRILKESNVINFPINCLENSESKITDPDVCGNNNLIKTPVSIAKSNLKRFSIDSGKSINDESPIFMMASGRKAPSYSMNALTKAGIIMNNNIWNTTSTLLYNNDNSLQDRSADGPGLIAVLNDPSVKTRQSLGDNIFAMTSRNDNVSKSSGFSTASGRNLAAVTEESLIRARQTLDDNTSAILTCNDNEIINPRFPIVNGRSLSYISEKSLNKAQKSLRDNTVLVSARNDNVFNNSCFSTAGGHGIAAISNKSLKKAQRILNDDSSQNISLQEKLQINVAGFNNSKLPVYDSISRFKVKESSWKDSGPRLKNKNTKIFSKHIDDHSHILLPKKRSKSHAQVSSNSSCLNILPFSRTSEYNSINKLFDLSFPLRRIGLKDIVSVYPLNFSLLHLQELGISKDIINMSPQNAISYRFTWSEGQSRENVDYLSVWGPSEALSNLIESGANSNLIDDHWVCNHYRWIVWKIASMIRSFPHEFRGWWNPKKVLDQLRYRYEREINNTHRSALKLIIEGDGTASIPMILCVSDIIKEEVNPITLGEIGTKDKIMYSLELTDMWYKIRADVDQPLQRAISKSKIRIGYKLEICGAKIVGSSVGVPALDVSNSTRLKLSANSTKLAHWDAKLGFRRFRPYATLRSLCPDGGYIFAIDIIILRKYPMIFRETMKDGTIIHRNEQEEEHAKSEHEVWLNNKIQSLINEYEMQHKQKNKCKSKILKKQAIQDMSKVTSGEQLYVMMQDCLEPSKFWQDLSSEQSVWLQNYIQKKEQENIDHMNKWVYGRLEELGYTRKVVPFFKVRVCDYLNTSIIGREAIINVWQPNELLFNTIKEGRRYKV
ncbi:hypothetical protein C1645_782072 [Glomus cerebriforme]|uniref:BRCA2 OB1 domain-containing protein n=1 Tax=Glomus cerebriforme TaxID=658196 RepID=A0A397SGI1_9GLOM|nr:hypothetical protein C1645_782072 [Glomus cerebriforme]